jgi:hypothetical protein
MIRLVGILSVILFWVLMIALSPVVLLLGTLIFVLAVCSAISSLVYHFVTDYLKRKKL